MPNALQISMVPNLTLTVHLVFQEKIYSIVVEIIPPRIVPLQLKADRRDVRRKVDIRIQYTNVAFDADIVTRNRAHNRKHKKQYLY